MSRFGVDESALSQMVSFAVHKGNLKWKLSSIPTIRFYSDLASTQTRLNKLLQQSHSLPNLVENKCAMHLGVNLRVAQVAGSQNCSSETPESDLEGKRKHSDIDSCVRAVAKLVGHLGVPEYGHGCKTFQEFLEMKTRNPQLQQTEKQYYNAAKTVKLARQVGSRYHVTAKNAGFYSFLRPSEIFLQI